MFKNYCKWPKFYKASHWQESEDDEGAVLWVGFKVDAKQGIILDAKWHAKDLEDEKKAFWDAEMDAVIGQKI